MTLLSLGNSVRLLGRGHSGTVSSRIAHSTFSRPGLGLRRGFASVRQQNALGLSYNTSRYLLPPNRILAGLVFTRHYSKDSSSPGAGAAGSSATPIEESASAAVSTPASEAMPDAASNITETASSVLDAIHTPLQYGDLAALGLTGWSPAGIVRWSMEIINTTTHLPWFWTIVVGTLIWRLALAPVSISGLRNSSRLQPHKDEVTKIQAQMNEAAKKSDQIARQKAAMKLRDVYQKAGVNMGTAILAPIVNIPVQLGIFFGIRGLCSLPVEQLKWSGLEILSDLTVPDPTWVLPVVLTALINAQISVGSAEVDIQTRPVMAHVMNGFRILTIPGFFFTATLPAGLQLGLVLGSLYFVVQSLLLQNVTIRRYLGINNLPEKNKLPTMRETMEFVIKSYTDRIAEAKGMQTHKIQRARASEQMKRFEEARRK